jgi:hypothetical protein
MCVCMYACLRMELIVSLQYSVKREWNGLNSMRRHMSGECREHCTMLVAHENALNLHLTIWHTKPYLNHTKSYLPTGCMRQAMTTALVGTVLLLRASYRASSMRSNQRETGKPRAHEWQLRARRHAVDSPLSFQRYSLSNPIWS